MTQCGMYFNLVVVEDERTKKPMGDIPPFQTASAEQSRVEVITRVADDSRN